MDSFKIFTIIGITISAILGIITLVLSLKSQRKSHRELLFSKQFDYFMELQELIAGFEDAVHDMNQNHEDALTASDRLYTLANEIDFLSTKNEIIIPESLFHPLNDFAIRCHEISTLSNRNPININTEFKNSFSNEIILLNEELRDYLGIEKLSVENTRLVNSRV